jgi:hypothetical protein
MTAAALVSEAGNEGRCFKNEVGTPGQVRIRRRVSADSEDEDRRNHVPAETPPAYPQEKRGALRHTYFADFIFSAFNRSACFPAVMLNYSLDGMCLEAPLAVLPGTSLHVRMEKDPRLSPLQATRPGFRTAALGEVKWCRKLNGANGSRYAIGIRCYVHY